VKILITGVAGFLGSHLALSLLEDGHEIIGIDDLSTGSLENITQHPKMTFYIEDVRTYSIPNVDVIFNLASPASPVHYQINPVKTFETNIFGTVAVLKAAKASKARVIQASTSEIYGDPLVSPQSENYWGNVNLIGPRACYDEGKRASETICFDYIRQFGLDARVARIFNTYGPNMAVGDGRVVSNFIVQSLLNKDLTIYGDGLQTRSLCYVSDLISALKKIMEIDINPQVPINIGNPTEITMIELAHLIISLTKSKSSLIFKELPQDDPKQRNPNIQLAKKVLKWEPEINLEDGLIKTVNYFRKILNL
jgi:UDP-glucuronate decarboxylase